MQEEEQGYPYHLEYEDESQGNVEGDEEEDEEERDHYYEGDYLDENEIDPEQGQRHSNSSRPESPQSVADGEEELIRRSPTESSPTMPGSLYARSPPPEPHTSEVYPTRSRHVRFAPGITSPAVRPPRRILASSPKTLAVAPGQIDSSDPPDLQHQYPKESPNFNRRKPQEVAKQSAGSWRITPSPSPNRIPKTPSRVPSGDLAGCPMPRTSLKASRSISGPSSFMQPPEPVPTRHVTRRLSSRVDETVEGFTPADSSSDRSMELERICQLEKEIKMLREEVSDFVAQTRRTLIKMTL